MQLYYMQLRYMQLQRDVALAKAAKADALLKKAEDRRLRSDDDRKRLAEQLSHI